MSWYKNSGCVCGTSERTARMNRSISFYIWSKVPTGELEQTIGWLDDVIQDCQYKIAELESIKRDRERAQEWRRDMNRIARQFYDPDALHLDLETRQQIVQQRLDVEPHRARQIAELVHAWAKRQQRKNDYAEICMKRRAGTKVSELADEYNYTRQQIYNILKKDPHLQFLR